MLIVDSSAAMAQDEKHQALAKQREDSDRWMEQQLAHAVYVQDNNLSVSNGQRQMGNGMLAPVFKTLIEGLHPKLRVDHHPYSEDLCVWFLKRAENWEWDERSKTFGGEQKVFVTAVRDTVVPEWSIMSTRLVKSYDPSRNVGIGNLGYTWVEVPYREETRGWRAVLAKLLNSEIVTLNQVQRAVDKYGSSDRPSWAAKTSQRSGVENPF